MSQKQTKQSKVPFEVYFALLKKVSEKSASANVPVRYTTKSGLHLGVWLKNIRAAYRQKKLGKKMNKQLTDQQIKDLETLGVSWNFKPPASKSTKENADTQENANTQTLAFMDGFKALSQFKRVHKHCSVPASNPLYTWCEEVRGMVQEQRLDTSQVNVLKAVGFRLSTFEELLIQISEFVAANGHCRIPSEHPCFQSVKAIRELKLAEDLEPDEEVMLDAIGFDWTTKTKCTFTNDGESEKKRKPVSANECSQGQIHDVDSDSFDLDGSVSGIRNRSLSNAASNGNGKDVQYHSDEEIVSVASDKENDATRKKAKHKTATFALDDSDDSDDSDALSAEHPPLASLRNTIKEGGRDRDTSSISISSRRESSADNPIADIASDKKHAKDLDAHDKCQSDLIGILKKRGRPTRVQVCVLGSNDNNGPAKSDCDGMTEDNILKLKLKELKDECRKRSLKLNGKKEDLAKRLIEAVRSK
jgi:hypothetical protein